MTELDSGRSGSRKLHRSINPQERLRRRLEKRNGQGKLRVKVLLHKKYEPRRLFFKKDKPKAVPHNRNFGPSKARYVHQRTRPLLWYQLLLSDDTIILPWWRPRRRRVPIISTPIITRLRLLQLNIIWPTIVITARAIRRRRIGLLLRSGVVRLRAVLLAVVGGWRVTGRRAPESPARAAVGRVAHSSASTGGDAARLFVLIGGWSVGLG